MKEYLPMGSVVLLKEGTKRIMIYGRKQIAAETGDEYDYVACLYPEGNISDEYTFLFNQEDIEQVVFEGYTDEEDQEFLKFLRESEE